jgi:hypothetical protein
VPSSRQRSGATKRTPGRARFGERCVYVGTLPPVSHGRGHWLDPSTAHHKSSTCTSGHLRARQEYSIIFQKFAWLCVDETGSAQTETSDRDGVPSRTQEKRLVDF